MTDSIQVVIEISSQTRGDNPQYHKVENQFITIGRGFDNDLIVNDPFICSNHLKINFSSDNENWILEELETENGFAINGKIAKDAYIPLKSGDYIRIGKTTLKIYDANHKVEETQKLIQQHGVFSMLEKSVNSWLLFFASLCFFSIYSYMRIWEEDTRNTLILMTISWSILILIWSAGWALVGRINKHKSYFSGQLGIISLAVIFSIILYTGQLYFNFIFNENIASMIVAFLLDITFIGLIIYSCLNFSSNMTAKKRFRVSSIVSISLATGLSIIALMGTQSFSAKPKYSSSLQPFLSFWTTGYDIKSYMKHNEELFSSDDIKIEQE